MRYEVPMHLAAADMPVFAAKITMNQQNNRSLEVYHAGILSYSEARALQEERRDRIIRGEASSALFLLQHPPTVTMGSLVEPGDLLVDETQLRERGISVIRTNRGGRATYHGPGQLVGYPVIDLRRVAARESSGPAAAEPSANLPAYSNNPSVRTYLRDLEEALIRTLARLEIEAGRRPGDTGVWVEDRKIASIGVAVRRWVTTHGFALNVDLDLSAFEVMRPCGFDAGIMTSIAREGGRMPPWMELEAIVADEFAGVFGFHPVQHHPSATG